MTTDETTNPLSTWLFRHRSSTRSNEHGSLFAILDAARDRRIHRALAETALDQRCLFAGRLHPELATVAPYLVELRPDARLVHLLLVQGWGRSWGIFVFAPASIEELRRHFRRFLRVVDERGKKMFFRYYDPRVLRMYLPTCTEGELNTVFGPVTRFIVEADDPARMLEFSLQRGALRTHTIDWENQSPSDAAIHRALSGS